MVNALEGEKFGKVPVQSVATGHLSRLVAVGGADTFARENKSSSHYSLALVSPTSRVSRTSSTRI